MAKSKRNSSSLIPILLIAGGVLVVLFVLILTLNSSSPESTAANTGNLNIPYADIPRIKPVDAKVAFDQKTAVFVDVRDADVFQNSRISGAVNIPLSGFDTAYSRLDPAKTIILYCT
jgi:hypothetical protein